MLALIAALAVSLQPAPLADPFSGGFIQFTVSTAKDPSSRLNRDQWKAVLVSMKELGMTTVILQQLAYRDNGTEYDVVRPNETDDATELILDEADKLGGMSVFLGLWNYKFFETDLATDTFLDDATTRSLQVLKTIKEKTHYTQHAAFAGWYLPIEPWNFNDNHGEADRLLNHYLVPLRNACKAVADKPVSFACYFNPAPEYADPAATAILYAKLLTDSKIDILMLQDGAGEKALSEVDCRRYLEACKTACDGKAKLWAILECFTNLGHDVRVPRDPALLPSQFNAAHGVADKFVTFDFFHYMNPHLYLWADHTESTKLCLGGPLAKRKPLYDGYRSLIGLAP